MPTYLCHGFRWHRRDIRIFVILNDLEDAAPNWILAPASSYCILDQLHAQFDFLPELTPPTTPTQASFSNAKNAKSESKPKPDHVDDDHDLPNSRVPDAEDAVLMHSWSPVKLLEEFDVDEMTMACRPYAYVADHVVRIDLSVDVAGEMAKYYERMAGDDGWIVKLRDQLQKGEPVKWYVIVCGDEVREVPGKSDEEEQEVGYEQLRERAQHMARARRTREIIAGSSNSPSEYEDDGDQDEDDALTVLEDILDHSEGATTPRPLSLELPNIHIPLQPRLDPTRASVLSTSTVWSQDQSPDETANTETPDIDKPLLPSALDPSRTSVSTAYSVWSRKETPDVDMRLRQSEITQYSTSTASGLHSENGRTRLEPEEFAKAQPPTQRFVREETPDVVRPLKPAELVSSRTSTPPTPKASQRQLPAPSLYRPESFIPPFSPPLPSSETFPDETPKSTVPNQAETTKPTEPSWPLSSDSPLGSSGSSTYRNEENSFPLVSSPAHCKNPPATTFSLPQEIMPPRIPSPASKYPPQPQFLGPTMSRFDESVPQASPLLVTPNPGRLEKPSSGVLYQAREPVPKKQPSSSLPRSRVVRAPPPLNINTANSIKRSPSNTVKNLTSPTSVQRGTSDPNMKTPPITPRTPKTPTERPLTQASPKSRLPRSGPKNIRLSTLPPPPDPAAKSPVRPPTPPKPKPRLAQKEMPQRRPQTAPEEGMLLRPNGGGFSRPLQYDVPRSMQKPGGEGVIPGPKLTPTSIPAVSAGYTWNATAQANASLDSATQARSRLSIQMVHPRPEPGPSAPAETFAQTSIELTLDDSDEEDLRSIVGSGSDVYELRDRDTSRDRNGSAIWDAEAGDDGDADRPLVAGRSRSPGSVASFQLYTPDEEQTVRRKFDRKLVLFVALLYMLSFVDRSNIGNARIAGMDEDLQSDPPRDEWYEWALTAFYITYIAFEWMSLLWKIIPAHIFVSMVVLTWGLMASLQAVATSYPMLIALRAVLGIGEAGFTGIPFYLSFFFKREELAFRTAIFISAAPLATTFASTLAWLIVKFASLGPIAPWRLLFIIEGFPSVVASVVAWNVIPDSPQTASYLTKREKKVARLRLRSEQATSTSTSSKPSSGLKGRDVLAIFRDPVAWITATMFFLTNMAYSSLPVFLPKILAEMGHDTHTSQALSAPPYLAAFVIVLFTAHMSNRLRTRTIPLIFHALASSSGYAILALAKPLNLPNFIRYMAVYPAAIGFFNVVTLIITWSINNQSSQSRQGGGFALLQLVGQCGPLVGTRLYPDRDAPYYAPGMSTCAEAMLGVSILAYALRFYLKYQNRKLDRAETEHFEEGDEVEEEGLVGSGRRKPIGVSFRYML
ncbi:unnamed protein product [Fusarium langsethiae]|nr:unnamed protein product [Fusarium langsethiae]